MPWRWREGGANSSHDCHLIRQRTSSNSGPRALRNNTRAGPMPIGSAAGARVVVWRPREADSSQRARPTMRRPSTRLDPVSPAPPPPSPRARASESPRCCHPPAFRSHPPSGASPDRQGIASDHSVPTLASGHQELSRSRRRGTSASTRNDRLLDEESTNQLTPPYSVKQPRPGPAGTRPPFHRAPIAQSFGESHTIHISPRPDAGHGG